MTYRLMLNQDWVAYHNKRDLEEEEEEDYDYDHFDSANCNDNLPKDYVYSGEENAYKDAYASFRWLRSRYPGEYYSKLQKKDTGLAGIFVDEVRATIKVTDPVNYNGYRWSPIKKQWIACTSDELKSVVSSILLTVVSVATSMWDRENGIDPDVRARMKTNVKFAKIRDRLRTFAGISAIWNLARVSLIDREFKVNDTPLVVKE